MIERGHSLAVTHQCELLALSRSSVYHQPAPVSEQDLEAMRLLDEAHLQFPFYGSRRLSDWLGERGVKANRKRVRRVMRLMGLEALYPRPRTSRAGKGHTVYPYLLRELTVERPNQVWATDICYLPMARGFLYLVAVMDWYSRKVLAWRLSNTLNGDFCIEAWRTRSPTMGVRRYSTPTRGHSSPARRSQKCSRARAWPSAWMARGDG